MSRFVDTITLNGLINTSTLSVTNSAYISNNLSIGGSFYGNGSNLTGIIQRYSATIGDTVTTTFTATHNLGTKDIIAQAYDTQIFDIVYPTFTIINTNQITINFMSAPSLSGIRIVVLGTGTGNSGLSSSSGSGATGYVNRIVNGNMIVDQRNAGAAQTITAGAALAYTVDRFYAYSTGANITGQQITTNGQRRYRLTGATSVSTVGFGQRIESYNSYDLASGTATLQAKLASSSLSAVTWAAYYANTTDTFGSLASPTKTLISTGNFLINSTENTYSTQITIPSAATTGIEILFTGGALLSSQTLSIGDVQLESGSSASSFERMSIRETLNNCHRYYVNSVYSNSIKCMSYFPSSTAMIMTTIYWPQPMRALPSVAFGNLVYNNCSGLTAEEYTASSVSVYVTSTGAGVAAVTFSYTATIEL